MIDGEPSQRCFAPALTGGDPLLVFLDASRQAFRLARLDYLAVIGFDPGGLLFRGLADL